MNNKTYIISDDSNRIKRIIKDLEIPQTQIISHKNYDTEAKTHEWLNREFQKKDIEKIIIPLSLDTNGNIINAIGLTLALHIRLNYEVNVKKRLIPIIILSNIYIENLITKFSFDKDNNPQNLLFTPGLYFSLFDSNEIKEKLAQTKEIKEKDYYENILPRLNIKRKAIYGKHDIANAWGAYKIALITGQSDKILKNEKVGKHLKQLYAKYLISSNQAFDNREFTDTAPLNINEKKILFIDDKASEGWHELLKTIFKDSKNEFVYVNDEKYKNDFEGFYQESKSHIGKNWDLIIIDLRLNPLKEDIDKSMIKPSELSGYKLIDEFLTHNEGYQIMVFTASNKIWNVNTALQRGAYAYYIKESPEFNYEIKETKMYFNNFKEDVKQGIKNKYLYDIWENYKIIKEHFEQNPLKKYFSTISLQFELLNALLYQDLILKELELIFYTLKSNYKKNKDSNKYYFAMLSMVKIIESIVEIFIKKDESTNKLKYWDDTEVSFCKNNSRQYNIIPKNNKIKSWNYFSTRNKIHCILFEKLQYNNFQTHQNIDELIKYRNNYIHPQKRFEVEKLSAIKILEWNNMIKEILLKI